MNDPFGYLNKLAEHEDPRLTMNYQMTEHEDLFYAMLVARIPSFPEKPQTLARLPGLALGYGIPVACAPTREAAVNALVMKMKCISITDRAAYIDWVFERQCNRWNTDARGFMQAGDVPKQELPRPDFQTVADVFINNETGDGYEDFGVAIIESPVDISDGGKYTATITDFTTGNGDDDFGVLGLHRRSANGTKLLELPGYPLAVGATAKKALESLEKKMSTVKFSNEWLDRVTRISSYISENYQIPSSELEVFK